MTLREEILELAKTAQASNEIEHRGTVDYHKCPKCEEFEDNAQMHRLELKLDKSKFAFTVCDLCFSLSSERTFANMVYEKLGAGGIEVLADMLNISDWRECTACDCDTPFLDQECMVCGQSPVGDIV